MYASYFGMQENPFNLSPDPRYFYLSPQHQEALNCLIYGINEKKGFMVITGGIGNGKTTLCRTLMARLDESVESALIFNSALSDLELLQTINQEFGIAVKRGRQTKKRCLDALNEFLLKNFAAGKRALLIIDEAQNCSLAALEQIRMLSNLETDREKLLSIILMGQPELAALLALPSLRQLNERITVRYDLKPLNRDNVQVYIAYRLTMAGGMDKVQFSRGAYNLIYRRSEGNPRRINALCDRALLIAYTEDVCAIDRKIVKKAVKDVGETYFLSKGRHGAFSRLLPASLLVVLSIALVGAGLFFLNFLK
jgi:general secretion pathway protein A